MKATRKEALARVERTSMCCSQVSKLHIISMCYFMNRKNVLKERENALR